MSERVSAEIVSHLFKEDLSTQAVLVFFDLKILLELIVPGVLFPDAEFYILQSILLTLLFLLGTVIFSPALHSSVITNYRKLNILVFRFVWPFNDLTVDRVYLIFKIVHFIDFWLLYLYYFLSFQGFHLFRHANRLLELIKIQFSGWDQSVLPFKHLGLRSCFYYRCSIVDFNCHSYLRLRLCGRMWYWLVLELSR